MKKPTVIGQRPNGEIGRKVTVIPSTPISHVEHVPTVKISGPTRIPGAVSTRINVTVALLRTTNPHANEVTLEQVCTMIRAVSVDTLTPKHAIIWGHDVQSEYGELVTECLKLSQSGTLTKVRTNINRTLEILEAIDIAAVCGVGTKKTGFIGGLIKKATIAIDSLPELNEAIKELQQLHKLMTGAMEKLLELRGKLDEITSKTDRLVRSIEVYAIAAQFLADHIKQIGQNELALSFEQRSMSLTQTIAQIQSNDLMRKQQVEEPLRLITVVQDVALVSVPGWIGSIVAIKTMLEGTNKPTVTEVNELSDQKQQITDRLKGKN